MRNATTFAKKLLSLSLLLLGVPNIIANKVKQGFCDLCCCCRDIHLRIFLIFFLFACAQPIMPRATKRRRRSRTAQALKKHKERLENSWRNQLEVFSDFCQEIKNPNGRSRTLEENKLLILALRAYLRQKVESMNEGDLHPSSINWTLIEEAVARDFCVRREYLTELRRIFLDEGDVVVFGMENARGGAAENYDHSTQQKVSSEHLIEMVKYID
jgi:hypothetical protein